MLTSDVAGRVARIGACESGGVAAGEVVLALDPVERQIAVEDALIGGLASSTVLVLTVTPALYLMFERRPERRRLAAANTGGGRV